MRDGRRRARRGHRADGRRQDDRGARARRAARLGVARFGRRHRGIDRARPSASCATARASTRCTRARRAQLLDALAAPGPNVISAAASVIDDPGRTRRDACPGCRRHLAPRPAGDPGHAVRLGRRAPAGLRRFARGVPGRAGGPSRAVRSARSARTSSTSTTIAPDEVVTRALGRARLASGSCPIGRRSSSMSTPGSTTASRCCTRWPRRTRRSLAATCVSGNVDARQVAINTRAILELAGRPDIEVALGREIPLVRALETTPETHGPQGLGHAELPPPTRPLSNASRGRRHRRRGAATAGRDHARHARPADQPRDRRPARACAARACSRATR